jgi:hypothetical protein
MLADQDAQLDAEDISGQPSIWGIDTDTTRFTSGTTRYVIPRSHNQFCQGSLPYITAATALLTTTATTFLSPATIRTDLFQLIFLHPIDLPSSNHGATD